MKLLAFLILTIFAAGCAHTAVSTTSGKESANCAWYRQAMNDLASSKEKVATAKRKAESDPIPANLEDLQSAEAGLSASQAALDMGMAADQAAYHSGHGPAPCKDS